MKFREYVFKPAVTYVCRITRDRTQNPAFDWIELDYRKTGCVAATFTIVNAVHNFVNAVHKMPKICERRSQFHFEKF